jgi:hypothetical protein
MRNWTPLTPGEPAFDVTVHIVLNDFGDRLGRAYCETDEAAADEASVIENIIDGEYSRPMRVVAFNTAEGWSRDVTEEIAARLLDLNAQGRAGSISTRFC